MDSPGIHKVRWAFTPIPTAPTTARRRLAEQLQAWGISAPDADPVLLVANELVANAVEHARTALALEVGFDGTAVVVEVHDESPLEPLLQPHNLRAARGRGLQMVAALAKSWSYVQHAGGKTIRAVVIPGLWVAAFLARLATLSGIALRAGYGRRPARYGGMLRGIATAFA
jgi:anti-sigma regulatory factor (Ser/Thr protein kinase)